MPQLNKYGSITETFLGDPLLLISPLSSKATPPADLNIVAADYAAAVPLWSGGVNFQNDQFFLGDVPRIVGVGIWCNLADGLVQIDNPDSFATGLQLGIGGTSHVQGGGVAQANILVPNVFFKVQEFNQIFEVDRLLDMSVLDYSLTGQPTQPFVNGPFFKLNAYLRSATMDFSMISIDPAYAAQPLYMRPMVVIEHSYPLYQL